MRILCNMHSKEVEMIVAVTTTRDGGFEESLECTKCHRHIPKSPQLQSMLEDQKKVEELEGKERDVYIPLNWK